MVPAARRTSALVNRALPLDLPCDDSKLRVVLCSCAADFVTDRFVIHCSVRLIMSLIAGCFVLELAVRLASGLPLFAEF